MNPLVPIVLSMLLKAPGLIAAIRDAFRHTVPGITDAQIAAAVVEITGRSDAAADDVLAQIAEDQAKG